MDFEKICMMFTMQEPYYGILLSSMRRIPVPESVCSTMGVARSGNVFKLGYNPNFVNNLDVDTTIELLKHEVLHVAMGQMTMWDDKDVSKEEHRLRNIAMDMEVNCYLNLSKMKGVNPVLPEKFGFAKKLGTREYYKKLIELAQQQQQQAQAQQPTKPCNGGQGGNSQQPQQQSQQGDDEQQEQEQSSNSGGKNNSSQQNNNSNGQGKQGQGNQISQNTIDQMMSGTDEIDDHSQWPDDMTQEEQELIGVPQRDNLLGEDLEYVGKDLQRAARTHADGATTTLYPAAHPALIHDVNHCQHRVGKQDEHRHQHTLDGGGQPLRHHAEEQVVEPGCYI